MPNKNSENGFGPHFQSREQRVINSMCAHFQKPSIVFLLELNSFHIQVMHSNNDLVEFRMAHHISFIRLFTYSLDRTIRNDSSGY